MLAQSGVNNPRDYSAIEYELSFHYILSICDDVESHDMHGRKS